MRLCCLSVVFSFFFFGFVLIALTNLEQNQIQLEQMAADAGYSSGESLAFCEQNNIDAYIPNFGQYKAEREGFEYNKAENYYQCTKSGGNKSKLLYKGERTDSKGYSKKTYRSSETACKDCPLRVQCCGATTKFKKLDDSIDKPYYDRMHQKLSSNPGYAKKMSKIRSRTVEPVLGTLINFLNMRRLNSRGMASANKHVLLSAMCYNLKKLLKFHRQKVKIVAKSLQNPSLIVGELLFYLKRSYTTQYLLF
jgi:hypothetical protein